MNFEALLAAMREAGGEYPDTFLDDASTAYSSDMGVVNGKVEALMEQVAALEAENLSLKSHNYDLIMSGASEPGANAEEHEDEDPEAEDDETLDELLGE